MNFRLLTLTFAVLGLATMPVVAEDLAVETAPAAAVEVERQCAVHYTRTACPGEEETSYKKCNGEVSCVKHKEAKTLEECQAAALKSCRNRRLNITESKVITATWKGEAIKSAAGDDDFCLSYPKRNDEFNHCSAE